MLLSESFTSRPVLIVDDSPMYRTAARGMLLKLGFKSDGIQYAQDAKEAIQRCHENSYGLVFFDYNLGDKTNGFQLIDELMVRKLLSPDCVTVIVTADATPEVVRGFMELEPDGYLLKPLNYMTLKERLPGFARRKLTLANILKAADDEQLELLDELVEEVVFNDPDCAVKAQLIRTQYLIKHQQLDVAKDALDAIGTKEDNGELRLIKSQLSLRLGQYKSALDVCQPLYTDSLFAARAHEQSALVYSHSKNYEQAVTSLSKSIKLSPKVISRHWALCLNLIAQDRLTDALAAAKAMLNEARFSVHESMDMYALGAMILIDAAQFGSVSQRNQYLKSVGSWVEVWRNRYSPLTYKPLEHLVFAHLHLLQNNQGALDVTLKEYQHSVKNTRSHKVSVFEQFLLCRLAFLTRQQQDYQSLYQQVKAATPYTHLHTLPAVFDKWHNKLEQSNQQLIKIKNQALQCIKSENFESASSLLSKAIQSQFADAELAKLLYHSLTVAWPQKAGRQEVIEIALRCRSLLSDNAFTGTDQFAEISNTLAKQLSYQELAS